MRKPDLEVREVVCSETGKPMPKIPMWMADVKVKFVSDEARQKHPTIGLNPLDIDLPTRTIGSSNSLEDMPEVDKASDIIAPIAGDFDDPEAEADEAGDDIEA